jgi:hypothetical protein
MSAWTMDSGRRLGQASAARSGRLGNGCSIARTWERAGAGADESSPR